MRRCVILISLVCGGTLLALSAFAQEASKPAPPNRKAAPPACQPKPGKNPCETCHENQCCGERRACEADPACSAFLDCLKTSCSTPPCNGKCGAPPPAYVARFACQMARCNVEVCGGPVDGCTLCTSTRCAAATLSCLNQPGCDEYAACVAGCGQDKPCQARCKKLSAAAATAAEARATCIRKECRSDCPSPKEH